MGGFLGALPILATSSRHIQSITCYECRACASKCPYSFDPAGFLLAGRTNNPQRRMLIQLDLRQTLEDGSPNPTGYNQLIASKDPKKLCNLSTLSKMDEYIRIKVRSGGQDKLITVKEAIEQGFSDSQVLETYEMKAVHAAHFCILCGNCNLTCPVDLPVTEYILDLKDDGGF